MKARNIDLLFDQIKTLVVGMGIVLVAIHMIVMLVS